jgi:sec-independent protein translocase protein TatB
MEILGIGFSELVFILLIAIIILGPKDMQRAGRTLGRWLNQLVRSDSWKVFQKTSTELRNLPRNLMRQANAEFQDVDQELKDVGKEIKEVHQTIDPRPRPPASRTSRNTLPPKKTNTPPQPPAVNPTDADDDPEKND